MSAHAGARHRMNRWYGKLLGLVAGALLFRPNPLFGAVIGLLVGHAFDSDWFGLRRRDNPYQDLGLAADATDAEVDQAYRRLISQYHPDRLAGRILQQGDILSLVEKAQVTVDEKEAERLARKVKTKKGLDLQDFLGAMRQMQKMGPLKNVLGMLPGVTPAQIAAKVDEKKIKHVEAIVLSMTPKERANPDLINGQRRLRIAKGSGRSVQEVNQLLTQFKQMQKFMKIAGKTGGMGNLPFGRGGFPG